MYNFIIGSPRKSQDDRFANSIIFKKTSRIFSTFLIETKFPKNLSSNPAKSSQTFSKFLKKSAHL